jgi:hypothetical protein
VENVLEIEYTDIIKKNYGQPMAMAGVNKGENSAVV